MKGIRRSGRIALQKPATSSLNLQEHVIRQASKNAGWKVRLQPKASTGSA